MKKYMLYLIKILNIEGLCRLYSRNIIKKGTSKVGFSLVTKKPRRNGKVRQQLLKVHSQNESLKIQLNPVNMNLQRIMI